MFTCPNESLTAIMSGLDISPSDRVLMIAASDQSFAVAEIAAHIDAVDFENVISFAQSRLRLILERSYDSFRAEDSYHQRHQYFNDDRLERIRNNLNRIHLHPGNIASFQPIQTYSKMYFSNVLGDGTGFFLDGVKRLFESLEMGGLIYFASTGMVQSLICNNSLSTWPLGLRQEASLTKNARKKEILWTPLVCKKVPEAIAKEWPSVFHYC